MYEKGLGVEKNAAEAAKWYKLAAALGCEEAKQRILELRKTSEYNALLRD